MLLGGLEQIALLVKNNSDITGDVQCTPPPNGCVSIIFIKVILDSNKDHKNQNRMKHV